MSRPPLLITIDTEGDDLWSAPRQITTRNSAVLGRFQSLCERYGFKPTWLTNWEMVQCPVFREFARDCLARGTAEIGMHLHAWNNPPLEPLTEDDYQHRPFLIEYPLTHIRDKIARLTDALEDAFGVKMVSHRAGRWAMNETYALLLVEHGYRVDCSVTPLVSWRSNLGDPQGAGGTDYTRFPAHAYWIDPNDFSRAGAGPLLEVPMSILPGPALGTVARRLLGPLPLGKRVAGRLFPQVEWLRPNRRNGRRLLQLVDACLAAGHHYVEFMQHSSEFLAGGSPYFPDQDSIERLFANLERLFAHAQQKLCGMTLAEFHQQFAHNNPSPSSPQVAASV